MTDRDLKRLSRAELLELLIAQTKETERVQAQLDEANAKLERRSIDIEEAGSIAEAALRINGVFETAQKAAAQYLENIKNLSDQQQVKCQKMKAECIAECEKMRAQAQEECREKTRATEAYWEAITRRLQLFYDEREGLRELLTKVETDNEQ